MTRICNATTRDYARWRRRRTVRAVLITALAGAEALVLFNDIYRGDLAHALIEVALLMIALYLMHDDVTS